MGNNVDRLLNELDNTTSSDDFSQTFMRASQRAQESSDGLAGANLQPNVANTVRPQQTTGMRPQQTTGVRPQPTVGARPQPQRPPMQGTNSGVQPRPAGQRPNPGMQGVSGQPNPGQRPVNQGQPQGSGQVQRPQPQQRPAQPMNQSQPQVQAQVQNQPRVQPQAQVNIQKTEDKVKVEISNKTSSKKSNVEPRVIEALEIPHETNIKVDGKQNFVLYAIVDKPIDGMLDYFRSYGLSVSHIYTNVDDVRDAMLMQVDPSMLIVIDTGSGKFVNMSVRNELKDLLGMMDEGNKATIFYCDSTLKYDIEYAKEVKGKDIKWLKYNTTAGVLADMLQIAKTYNFNYIIDTDYGKTTDIVEDLCVKGVVDPEYDKKLLSNVQLNTSAIVARQQQATADNPMIESFKVII